MLLESRPRARRARHPRSTSLPMRRSPGQPLRFALPLLPLPPRLRHCKPTSLLPLSTPRLSSRIDPFSLLPLLRAPAHPSSDKHSRPSLPCNSTSIINSSSNSNNSTSTSFPAVASPRHHRGAPASPRLTLHPRKATIPRHPLNPRCTPLSPTASSTRSLPPTPTL